MTDPSGTSTSIAGCAYAASKRRVPANLLLRRLLRRLRRRLLGRRVARIPHSLRDVGLLVGLGKLPLSECEVFHHVKFKQLSHTFL